MPAERTVRHERSGAVGLVTLDRPAVLNAYSVQMRDELHELLGGLARDADLRVVVFRGAGRAFCAGADLGEFGTAPSPFEARRIRFERDVWAALRGLPVPTIAALHGHAIGSGLELALHCNLRVATRSASLWMPEARVGVLPAAGGTQTIPRLSPHAARILLLGEPIDGATALEHGLVDVVVDDDELEARSLALAGQIARTPRATLVGLVRLLRLQDNLSVGDAIAVERRLALRRSATRGRRR
ncbi:MAG TPA: enoyl-CoA hydratase/isomerase family protein [Solirubrobacterales bacterium]|nr:enoyl-CoA hydratase/isomerase family protein [Solirubrobacterales bacterium]